MKKGKAILVVGHEAWGKSVTLEHLTDGNPYKKIITVNDQRVWVRHTSNDDELPHDPRSYYKFIAGQNGSESYLVIAFCPNTKEDTIWVLDKLKENYELIFWVIKHSQNPEDRTARQITEGEIMRLRRY